MSSTTGHTAADFLGAKDANLDSVNASSSATTKDAFVNKGDVKTMEHHRQVLQSKMEAQSGASNNYVSPSDEIMSPCTAKLNALRNKQVGKVKPRSLFAQASSKRLRGNEDVFGSETNSSPSPTQ